MSFNFLDCPACNVRIDPDQTPYLKDMMKPHKEMENEVKRKATQRLRESSAIPELLQLKLGDKAEVEEEERITALAMRRFNYYPCSRCAPACLHLPKCWPKRMDWPCAITDER